VNLVLITVKRIEGRWKNVVIGGGAGLEQPATVCRSRGSLECKDNSLVQTQSRAVLVEKSMEYGTGYHESRDPR